MALAAGVELVVVTTVFFWLGISIIMMVLLVAAAAINWFPSSISGVGQQWWYQTINVGNSIMEKKQQLGTCATNT